MLKLFDVFLIISIKKLNIAVMYEQFFSFMNKFMRNITFAYYKFKYRLT